MKEPTQHDRDEIGLFNMLLSHRLVQRTGAFIEPEVLAAAGIEAAGLIGAWEAGDIEAAETIARSCKEVGDAVAALETKRAENQPKH